MNHTTRKRLARVRSVKKRRNILRNNTKAENKNKVEHALFPKSSATSAMRGFNMFRR